MRLGKILFLWGVLFVFAVIYQHNLIIKLNYTKQRLVQKRDKLQKERNELMRQLCQLKDLHSVKEWAINERGMTDMSLSRVFTLTTAGGCDFYGTPTMRCGAIS